MVQTLAALLSWIAMLALIAIAVLVSGVWRPRLRASLVTEVQPPFYRVVPTLAQSLVKPQSSPQSIRKSDARDIPRDIARALPHAIARDAASHHGGQPRRAA